MRPPPQRSGKGRKHGTAWLGELLRHRRGAARRERGGASHARRRRRRRAPPFRFSRHGPQGVGASSATPNRKKIGVAMTEGRRRPSRDPGRLHLPRPVRRPRPDVRQDDGHARRARLAGAAAAGPLAEPRPRLALRRRAAAIPARRSSTRPTAAPEDRQRPPRPARPGDARASTCRAAPARRAKKRKA